MTIPINMEEFSVVAHICNPSTGDATRGRILLTPDQPLHDESAAYHTVGSRQPGIHRETKNECPCKSRQDREARQGSRHCIIVKNGHATHHRKCYYGNPIVPRFLRAGSGPPPPPCTPKLVAVQGKVAQDFYDYSQSHLSSLLDPQQ